MGRAVESVESLPDRMGDAMTIWQILAADRGRRFRRRSPKFFSCKDAEYDGLGQTPQAAIFIFPVVLKALGVTISMF
jgi:hypothetical protein